jgi:hypothetical protein
MDDETRQPPFAEGQRVRMRSMMAEDPNPIERGDQGNIVSCHWISMFDEWQVQVDWDSGRTLICIFPQDDLEAI